jgi:hypothetical protein
VEVITKEMRQYHFEVSRKNAEGCQLDADAVLIHHPQLASLIQFREKGQGQSLNNPDLANRMGENAREYIRTNFLITRQIRDYLSLWYVMENPGRTILEL